MTRKTRIPSFDVSHCAECQVFQQKANDRMRERDLAMESAFDAAEIAQIEQDFDAAYMEIFRAWMDHKRTHETGSIRKYLAQFREQPRA